MKRWIVIPAIVAMLSWGCEGKQGPAGPAGAQGEPGPGTRVVYSRSDPIPESPNPFIVAIPSLSIDDLPAVSVYAWSAAEGLVEAPFYAQNAEIPYTVYYIIADGEIQLWNFVDFGYQIVLVE